jgi:DeoR/GlpR family transcriptional regulator of sugar metabolism
MSNKRYEIILKLLQENGQVSSLALSERFGVSMETIRRDLQFLEREGHLMRVHGGALAKSQTGIEPNYRSRVVKNLEEKQRIGRAAAALVADDETLIIDVGTTTLELAKALRSKNNLTVITNAIPVVLALEENPSARVLMLGGTVRGGELSSAGPFAEQMVNAFCVDKVFLGIGGIDLAKGITDYHMAEANLRRHFIQLGDKVIGLADYSKFGVTALNRICNVKALDYLVTDSQTSPRALAKLRQLGVIPIIAD